MCGFVGFLQSIDQPLDLPLLARTCRLLRHRGPDDEGFLLVNTSGPKSQPCAGSDTDPSLGLPPLASYSGESFNLGLGFRRLAILDPSIRGHQPMASADGRCWVVFNGEIYNYIELRSELESAGHLFRTNTDTEVLLAAYREWGLACLQRFTGMWAFCIWDSLRRELFLARDPFGIKPLYYWRRGKAYVFASEIKALLEVPSVPRLAQPQRLYDFLRFGWSDHGEDTLFQGIHQVPAGHWMTVSVDQPGQSQLERYWTLSTTNTCDLSREDAASQLRRLFLKSIDLHLRSDVSVGSALSGGIDSSSIVAGIRHIRPKAIELDTFSHIDSEPSLSEEHWVDLVAQTSGVRSHKVHPRPNELMRDLAQLVYSQDQPFASTSIYAQYRVFRLAQEAGIKVMLDGQGADEIFGGYPSYLSGRLASLVRHGHWIRALRFLSQALRLPDVDTRSTLVRAGGLLLPHSLEGPARTLSGESFIPGWMNRRWVRRHGVVPSPLRGTPGKNPLRDQLRQALLERSLPALLRYEDRNSMASSIESRVPFLTTDIVEFAFSLPEDYIIDENGTSKSIFRDAMRGIAPDEVLNRKDKIGFATSEQSWLSSLRPALQKVLESEAASAIPALNHDVMRREAEGVDYRLWRWLSVAWWGEQFSVQFEH